MTGYCLKGDSFCNSEKVTFIEYSRKQREELLSTHSWFLWRFQAKTESCTWNKAVFCQFGGAGGEDVVFLFSACLPRRAWPHLTWGPGAGSTPSLPSQTLAPPRCAVLPLHHRSWMNNSMREAEGEELSGSHFVVGLHQAPRFRSQLSGERSCEAKMGWTPLAYDVWGDMLLLVFPGLVPQDHHCLRFGSSFLFLCCLSEVRARSLLCLVLQTCPLFSPHVAVCGSLGFEGLLFPLLLRESFHALFKTLVRLCCLTGHLISISGQNCSLPRPVVS